MYGNGAKIGIVLHILPQIQWKILKGVTVVPIVLIGVVAGTTMLRAAALLTAATTALPATVLITWGSA